MIGSTDIPTSPLTSKKNVANTEDSCTIKLLITQLLNENFLLLKDLQKEVIIDLTTKTLSPPNPIKADSCNFLLDITTGFGKSYLQIVYSYILESYNINYRIVLPKRLIAQFEVDIDNIIKDKAIAENIKNKITEHITFFKENWKDKYCNQAIIMIDEVDEIIESELYKERLSQLLEDKNCTVICSTATATKWLQQKMTINQTNAKKAYIKSVSYMEKLSCFKMIDNNTVQLVAKSLIKRTNKRSKFLPYAFINVISTLIIISIKIYFNTIAVHLIKDFLIKNNLYNFYIYVFLINPIMGIISLLVAWVFVISPINFIINKIANRDITSRLLANLEDHNFSSPAYDDLFETDETFIFHNSKYYNDYFKEISSLDNVKDLNKKELAKKKIIQSPKGEKSLLITDDPEIIENLYYIYCDNRGIICQNGKKRVVDSIYNKECLGKDFNEKYDHSFKESQISWSKLQYDKKSYLKAKELSCGNKEHHKNLYEYFKNCDIDLSDTRQYTKYRVLHGIIKQALLIILTHNDDQKKYSTDCEIEEVYRYINDIKNELESLKKKYLTDNTIIDCLTKKYLKDKKICEKNFTTTEILEIQKAIVKVIHTLINNRNHTNIDSIILNWNLDRTIHDMMEKGNEYQILDDLITSTTRDSQTVVFFDKIANNILSDLFDKKTLSELQQTRQPENPKITKFDYLLSIIREKKLEELISFFRYNNLFKKINEKKENFPLYELRDICDKYKIIFVDPPDIILDSDKSFPKLNLQKSKILFREGLIGTLVDSKLQLIAGYSDNNLHNVAVLVGKNSIKLSDPRAAEQALGRLRNFEPSITEFARYISSNPTPSVNIATFKRGANCTKLFPLKEKYKKVFRKNLTKELIEELIRSIELDKNNSKDICYKLTEKKFEDLYNINEHNLNLTKKHFLKTLDDVIKHLSNYSNKVKNRGKVSPLYYIPYFILYYSVKCFYYTWVSLNYVIFCICTYENLSQNKGTNVTPDQVYIKIIKSYTITSSIKNYEIIKKMVSLLPEPGSNDNENKYYNDLLSKFLNNTISKTALKNIYSLDEKYLSVIIKAIYQDDKINDDEIKKIIKKAKEIEKNNTNNYEENRNTIIHLLNIAKEILALHAWYHDSSKELIIDTPKIKLLQNNNQDSVFNHKNVGNLLKFTGPPTKLLFDTQARKYRLEYGNLLRTSITYLFKWFIIIVIIPQFPYLYFSISTSSFLSTLLCIPLVSFIFGYPEKCREFIFSTRISECNALEIIAKESLITEIEKNIPKTLKDIRTNIKDKLNPKTPDCQLTQNDIATGTHLSPINKFYNTVCYP